MGSHTDQRRQRLRTSDFRWCIDKPGFWVGKQTKLKVTGYNFNFARAIINLYAKHWAVSAENFGVSFRGVKTLCDRIYGLF